MGTGAKPRWVRDRAGRRDFAADQQSAKDEGEKDTVNVNDSKFNRACGG